jgi:uncharacterized protein with HEPN domain
MRTTRERLQDIAEAIAKIETGAAKGKEAFLEDELLQVWMVHHLMIIGEAVRAIDPSFRQKHPETPWRQIAGMRNILVHDYFRINHEIVWRTVTDDLPALRQNVEELLSQTE